jgi:Flp pilus assembly protein TadB
LDPFQQQQQQQQQQLRTQEAMRQQQENMQRQFRDEQWTQGRRRFRTRGRGGPLRKLVSLVVFLAIAAVAVYLLTHMGHWTPGQ